MPDALLVFNPVAGRFDVHDLVGKVAAQLERDGWRLEVVESRSGAHTTELAERAAAEGLDALLVAGGDGSVGQAAAGLVGSQTALGVLPVGTSNVWARELGLPGVSWTNRDALLQVAAELSPHRIRAVDVGLCNGRYPFLLWAGVGLDAMVVHQMEARRRKHRRVAVPGYVGATLRRAYTWEGVEIEVQADGKSITEHVILAVAANIRAYMGGLAQLSPAARLDDGEMDLWLFKGDRFGRTLWHAFDLLANRHLRSQWIQAIPFRKLRLEARAPLCTQLDGDPMELSGPVEIEVRPRALRILAPQSLPEGLLST